MGIKGLSAALSRYGVFCELSGNTVVIDGPALVYEILNGCLRQRGPSNSFLCHPSYSTVGRLVIGWLDELRRHDVTVRKIYFDGYLPPSKWQVRRYRLLKQSQTMKDLLVSYPLGSPRSPKDAFDAITPEISLTQNSNYWPALRWLPQPPFLIPAILEVLKRCRTWGPLVEVVSGEADMFCAEDIRRHDGGVLLTGDSDLLITDLGQFGTVSFFTDVAAANPSDNSQGLLARNFSLHDINGTLGLRNVGGLPRVAFEMVSGQVSFEQALSQAKNNNIDALKSPKFQAFMEEYSMKEYLPKDHRVQRILSNLDPRISEIIVQTQLLDGNMTVSDADSSGNSRGPETLAMFLPIMIENRIKRKSAWTMSTAVRELAYGAMQTVAVRPSPIVIEYRAHEQSNFKLGRQIDVPGPEETLEQCGLLVDTLSQLTERIPSPDMLWLAFSIYQDVMLSSSEQRSPLSALLVGKGKDALSDTRKHSWDIIHFTAQVQASLYSLRMVKQVLDVVASLRTLPPPMQELRERLNTLPPIAEWPTVETISHDLVSAGGANVLFVVVGMLGVKIINNTVLDKNQAKERKKRNPLLRSERDATRPTSVNPFAALSNASRDR
ncbi:hypothetical protein F4803DRAFT_260884 [Xylaria telfairii]|nr:hypothetical protein F4803DRAFT_260884 [Xylaria telfairii]